MTDQVGAGADPVIRVEGLQKIYGETRAVDGISFEVRPGTIFGMLGPNGAGKTTTVEVLEGLRQPDAGEVRVLGIDAVRDADQLRARIGVSLQTAALYPKLTVFEVLTLFRAFYPSGREPDELIELMDLGEKRSTRTQNLSGGQRQRLSVALALVNDPELVFLDEPTTGHGPGRAAGPVGRRPRHPRRRPHGAPDDALPRGGGGPLRPGRDHGPRQDPRGGHGRRAGQPAVQGARRPVRRDRRARRRAARGAARRVVGQARGRRGARLHPRRRRRRSAGSSPRRRSSAWSRRTSASAGRRSRTSSST